MREPVAEKSGWRPVVSPMALSRLAESDLTGRALISLFQTLSAGKSGHGAAVAVGLAVAVAVGAAVGLADGAGVAVALGRWVGCGFGLPDPRAMARPGRVGDATNARISRAAGIPRMPGLRVRAMKAAPPWAVQPMRVKAPESTGEARRGGRPHRAGAQHHRSGGMRLLPGRHLQHRGGVLAPRLPPPA